MESILQGLVKWMNEAQVVHYMLVWRNGNEILIIFPLGLLCFFFFFFSVSCLVLLEAKDAFFLMMKIVYDL